MYKLTKQFLPHFFENMFIKISDAHIMLSNHWGRVTFICISTLTIIGSNNGFSPGWRQAIIWTNAGILLIEPLGTNFSELLIEIHIFSFRSCVWKCRLYNHDNGGHFVSASMCLTNWLDVCSLSCCRENPKNYEALWEEIWDLLT